MRFSNFCFGIFKSIMVDAAVVAASYRNHCLWTRTVGIDKLKKRTGHSIMGTVRYICWKRSEVSLDKFPHYWNYYSLFLFRKRKVIINWEDAVNWPNVGGLCKTENQLYVALDWCGQACPKYSKKQQVLIILEMTMEKFDVYLHVKNQVHSWLLSWNISNILQICYFWYFEHN